jgi:group I intron endonuclease
MDGQIYMIRCNINNKKYIGQTKIYRKNTKNFNYLKRWNEHINEAIKTPNEGCIALNNAILKYGKENFTVSLVTNCHISELDELETMYIKINDTLCPNGYNIRTGGINGKHCDESKNRMRLSKLGNKNPNFGKPRSDATKTKISEAKTGEKHHFYGKKLESSHKLKLSQSHRKYNDLQLPMHITEYKERPNHYCSAGYSVFDPITKKRKYFTSNKLDMQEKYILALEYQLKIEIDRYNAQRLYDSGSYDIGLKT